MSARKNKRNDRQSTEHSIEINFDCFLSFSFSISFSLSFSFSFAFFSSAVSIITLVSASSAHGSSVVPATSLALVSGQSNGPVFLDTFTEQTIEPGSSVSVSLRCIASGHPLPQVTWLLDTQPIPDHSRFRTGDYVTRDSVVVVSDMPPTPKRSLVTELSVSFATELRQYHQRDSSGWWCLCEYDDHGFFSFLCILRHW